MVLRSGLLVEDERELFEQGDAGADGAFLFGEVAELDSAIAEMGSVDAGSEFVKVVMECV